MVSSKMASKSSSSISVINVFGHGNRGDAMLIEALISILRSTESKIDVYGVAFDVESEEAWAPSITWSERVCNSTRKGILARAQQLLNMFFVIFFLTIKSPNWLRFILPNRQYKAIQGMQMSKLVISCPGGYIEDSNFAFYINLLQIWIALKLGKIVVLAPQSIGPVRGSIGRHLLKKVLNRVNYIFYREMESFGFLAELLKPPLPSQYKFSGDLAFWFNSNTGSRDIVDNELLDMGLDISRPIIGMTVINWSFPESENPKKDMELYTEKMASLCRLFLEQGKQVLIFNQVSHDLTVAESVKKLAPGVFVDTSDRDCSLYRDMVARCEFFVASRFHSCIFALLGSVPCVAISYLPKTVGIMNDLSLGNYVFDITKFEIKDIIASLNETDLQTFSEIITTQVDRYKIENGMFNEWLNSYLRSNFNSSQI